MTDWEIGQVVIYPKIHPRNRRLVVEASKLKGQVTVDRVVMVGRCCLVVGESKHVNEREEVCGLLRGCSSDGRALA